MYKKVMRSQVFRYLLVGASAFVTEYSVFLLLTSAVANIVILAQTVSFCAGLVVSFIGSRLFTFKNAEGEFRHTRSKQFTAYVVLAIVNLLLTNVLIYILVERVGFMPWVAKLITMLSVVVWNFVIFQRVIFKKI